MIPLILLHIALTAQAATPQITRGCWGSDVPFSDKCFGMHDVTYDGCNWCGVDDVTGFRGCTLRGCIKPDQAADSAMPPINTPSVEHVIEIRTKRKLTNWMQVCSLVSWGYGPSCEIVKLGKDGPRCPQGSECEPVYDITKEIWLDGVRWGVLRETEEK